jgi:hypothetical protein
VNAFFSAGFVQFLTCVCLAALAFPAEADEMQINDLRLEWSPVFGQDLDVVGPFALDIPDQSVSERGTEDTTLTVTAHNRVGIDYVRGMHALEASRGSFLAGVFASYDRIEAQDGTLGQTAIVDFFGGWAWALTPSWHVEEGLLVGMGYSWWRLQTEAGHFDGTDKRMSSNDLIYEYGIRLGTTYCWNNVVLIAEARYMVSKSSQRFDDDYSAGGVEETTSWKATIRSEGPVVTLGLGYRF